MARSMGMCYLCRKPYTRQGMARHLKACRSDDQWFDEKGDGGAGQTALRHKYFHIVVEGKDLPEYWLHVAVPQNATLQDLDEFLRDIWLECCGHFSQFLIDGVVYTNAASDFADFQKTRSLNNLCGDVLTSGKRFVYEYDFGDTTRLSLRVLDDFRFPFAVDPRIYVFARNIQPEIHCVHCGEPAMHVCASCQWGGDGWLCDTCADKHPCGPDALLPAVNSPRVGICGYTGNLPWSGNPFDDEDEDFWADGDAAAAFGEDVDLLSFLKSDPFVMERLLWRMNRVVNENANKHSDDGGGNDVDVDDPVWQAQKLAWEAYATDDNEARELAYAALKLDPDCADAYVVLGNLAEDPQTAAKEYRKGVEAGRRAIVRESGDDAFETDAGRFWGIVTTRPYMRALEGLAMALRTDGKDAEAIRHMQELLRLNPEDNQGIRYTLINCYLELGLTAEAGRLIAQFGDDRSSHWLYSKALWRYQRSGASESARRALVDAFATNQHVPIRMAEIMYQIMERNEEPDLDPTLDVYAPGSPEEADIYIFDSFRAWAESGDALIWLTSETLRLKGSHATPRHTEKIGRNAPCPCGSGKKYKKCCGR